ncbi:MAG: tetratricopeptide repeat protein [Proteobacteria bacterium]|nr:tetratricopeptide repeat protein [Pseudomonadota bacterium]
MSEAEYRKWVERAREHRDAGRALDALTCYRRAARIAPQAVAPHWNIGRLFWQLGRPRDAVAAWRRVIERAPEHVMAWQAQADAALFARDFATARTASAAALALAPDEPRMRLIAALVADTVDGPTVTERVLAAPALTDEPHIARMVAEVLRRPVAGRGWEPLQRALAAREVKEPWLLAALGPHATDAAIEAWLATAETDGRDDDLDALRALAVGLLAGTPPRPALGARVAGVYAHAAWRRHACDVPLLWPRRTGAPSLRALILTDGVDRAALHAAVAAAAPLANHDDITILAAVAAPEAHDAQPRAEALRAHVRAALAGTACADAMIAVLTPYPDIESARVVALRDADVLIDLAGLATASAPLFAARVARAQWSLAGPLALGAPLSDRVFPGADAEFEAALAAVAADVRRQPARPPVADLALQLDAAVRANAEGDRAAARAGYDALLADEPRHAPTLYLRATLRREEGDDEGALADFRAAVDAAPRDARSRAAAADLELRRHDPAAAEALVAAGLALAPRDINLLRAAGHVAIERRDPVRAIDTFAGAVSLEPLNAETHYNYGVALQMLQRPQDAARAYQRALALAPDMVEAHFNLGIVFHALGNVDAAVQALEWVIAREPRRAEAHRTLVDVLAGAPGNRIAAWRAAVLRFERDCPDALGLVAPALECHQQAGNFRAVERYLERLAREEFKPAHERDLVDSLEQLLYLMLFFDTDVEMRAALYRTYDRVAQRIYGTPLARPPQRKPGRLRVGYLSADLRDHVMGRQMLPALEQHDRARFEIHLYSLAPADHDDAVTARYRAIADRFETLATMADNDAVALIDAADLDILVDLSTHTRGARPGIVARKPARVQITHMASSGGALGMSAVDFKLTDALADRPEAADEYVERLLPMEGCLYPARPLPMPAVHPFSRAALGIAPDAIVIGAFVTPLKLSRRTLKLWKDVLTAVPRARLAFSPNASWLRDAYANLLAAAGIDDARVVYIPQGRDEGERLARYALVDFVLDPMPFGNVNGTLEPLAAGVPVVTLAGATHGERTGLTLLTHAGITTTIADGGRDYVALAVRLATDPGFLQAARAEVVAKFARSPLVDMARYARNLEAAYERALQAASSAAPNAAA